MGRHPNRPLRSWPPEMAAKIKWAKYHSGVAKAPTMTGEEALNNLYEELLDAVNYYDIAAANGVTLDQSVRQTLVDLASTLHARGAGQ